MSGNQDNPGGLPMFPAGWGAGKLAFTGGDVFWDRVEEITASGGLAESLDTAMDGSASPRVWLIFHDPGQGALSAATALSFARELGRRDMMSLVIDCDDTDCALTNWAGRQEMEGWIDLVRYGASVMTSGIPLPFAGRRGYLLGVGSFTPTEVTVEEMDLMLKRLKRQADDILLVLPANAAGLQWAQLAPIRLLCRDRSLDLSDSQEQFMAEAAAAGAPLTGVVGFGIPTEVEDAAVVSEAATEEVAETAPEPVEAKTETEPDASEDKPVDYEEVWQEKSDTYPGSRPGEDAEWAHRRKNSGVFWGVAVAALAMIVVASVYYMKFVHVSEDGSFGGAHLATMAPTQGQLDQAMPEGRQDPLADASRPVTDLDEVPETAETPVNLALDQGPGEDAAAETETTTETQPEIQIKDETPVEVPEETPAVAEAKPAPAPRFDMAPYLSTVGEGGWALHVYSFNDSTKAHEQIRRLERRGFHTATRVVEMKDGRWIRVFLGSFESKSEAMEAKGALLKKIKEDWARVASF